MRVSAVVAAAGAGRRFGGEFGKTYRPIAGRPLLLRTLDGVFSSPLVDLTVVVAAPREMERCGALLHADAGLRDRSWRLTAGGLTRQQSVRLGLEKIDAETDVVVVHDGARPLVSAALIERCVAAARDKGAAVAGLPVRDTIKEVSAEGWVRATPDRDSLWEIQTPQAFRRDLIVAAHEKAAKDGAHATDDATLIERMGWPVFVVEGERLNFKITVAEDLRLAEMILAERSAR